MCGIAGIVSIDGSPLPAAVIERMTAALRHRGPDDSGVWQDSRCALGHQRLSIIDLSRNGRQPLAGRDGSAQVAYNGEIYNHRELRNALIRRGHSFRSRTDTEVIVRLYDEEGDGLLHKLDGMFAFAIWDPQRRRLLLARDRLGIKPLYYAQAVGREGRLLLFASEIKALVAGGDLNPAPNIDAVAAYLGYRHPVSSETMFSGIHSLPAGHTLTVERGEVKIEPYWELPHPDGETDLGERHYLEQTRSLVSDAVEKRLMSDVPLGAYLSGGLDSSIVVALMAEQLGPGLKTYSVSVGNVVGEADDDTAHARLVAQHFKTDHTEVRLDPSRYMELLPELIRQRDAPLAVPNEVPLYEMTRALQEDITVVLSGEGADELFAGYGDYCRIPFDFHKAHALRRLPARLRRLLDGGMAAKYGGRTQFDGELDHFLAGYNWFGPEERSGLLSPDARRALRSSTAERAFARLFEGTAGLPYYDRVLHVLQKTHLQNLLTRIDAMTMASSVEARVPFVDHALVEAVVRMPLRYKLRWRSPFHRARAAFSFSDELRERDDVTKYILRRAFADALPDAIVNRRKIGFKVPLARWLNSGFLAHARYLLLSDESRERGVLDPVALDHWLERGGAINQAGGGDFGTKLWMLVNLEEWFRAYFPDYVLDGSTVAQAQEPAAVTAAVSP